MTDDCDGIRITKTTKDYETITNHVSRLTYDQRLTIYDSKEISMSHMKKIATVFPLAAAHFARAVGAVAVGSFALGAITVGSVAIGRIALGKLVARKVRIDELEIGTLRV